MRLPRPLPVFVALAVASALPATGHAATGATIGAVDCAAGGSITTLTNDGGNPVRFIVFRNDRAIANVVVPPGPPTTRVVPITEGAAAQITVRSEGRYVSGYVRRNCTASQAPDERAPIVARADAGPLGAAPVVPGTGVRGATNATAEPDRGASAASDATATDASAVWPKLLVAGLALALALALSLPLTAGRVRRRLQGDAAPPAPAARRPA